jgi:hypothetical protein
MAREGSVRLLVSLLAGGLGKMLDQVSPPHDVEKLHPATDRQNRHASIQCSFHEGRLGRIAVLPNHDGLRMAFRPIQGRIQVGSSCEDDAVECIEGFVNGVRLRR